jgi:CDP-paratose 2-epimerase
MDQFIRNPRVAEVYNLGGGRQNSISIIEAFQLIEKVSGKAMQYKYSDQNRKGDHICYISNLSKMQGHYPQWGITKDLPTMFMEIYESWVRRPDTGR